MTTHAHTAGDRSGGRKGGTGRSRGSYRYSYRYKAIDAHTEIATGTNTETRDTAYRNRDTATDTKKQLQRCLHG